MYNDITSHVLIVLFEQELHHIHSYSIIIALMMYVVMAGNKMTTILSNVKKT
jgi:hypothetical protein